MSSYASTTTNFEQPPETPSNEAKGCGSPAKHSRKIGDEQHPRTALDFTTAISIARAALARLPDLPVEEQADE